MSCVHQFKHAGSSISTGGSCTNVYVGFNVRCKWTRARCSVVKGDVDHVAIWKFRRLTHRRTRENWAIAISNATLTISCLWTHLRFTLLFTTAVGGDLPHNFIRDCDITTCVIPIEGSMTESSDLSVDDSWSNTLASCRRNANCNAIGSPLKF